MKGIFARGRNEASSTRGVRNAGVFPCVLAGLLLAQGTAYADDPLRDDSLSFYEAIDEDNPNPRDYQFSFVSVGLNQNWGLVNWSGGGVYFGAGGGLGTPVYRISQMGDKDVGIDPTIEALFGNVYLRLAPAEYVHLDVGGRLAVGSTTFDVPDAPLAAFVRGAYGDLFIGSKKIKFGARFEYDSILYMDFSEEGWKVTPLMLRLTQ